MDFAITEEHRMMVDSVRQFREKELMPLEKEFLIKGKLDIEVRHGLERKGREAGFWALEVPAEYGGNDVGQLAMCLINEELFKHPAMFEFGGSPEPALYLCNDEQKQRFFYPIINGEKHSCYAFTEPDAGSDLARIRTSAVRDGRSLDRQRHQDLHFVRRGRRFRHPVHHLEPQGRSEGNHLLPGRDGHAGLQSRARDSHDGRQLGPA